MRTRDRIQSYLRGSLGKCSPLPAPIKQLTPGDSGEADHNVSLTPILS